MRKCLQSIAADIEEEATTIVGMTFRLDQLMVRDAVLVFSVAPFKSTGNLV